MAASRPAPLSKGEEEFALHCKAYGLYPVRELEFAMPRRWRFDFCWPEHRIAVEIEGGTRKMGRHQFHGGFESDCRKYNTAAIEGWAVLRFTTEMVKSGEAIDTVRKFLQVGDTGR